MSVRSGRLWWLAVAWAASVCSAAHTAQADPGPMFGNGLWLPVGLSLGGAFRGDLPTGFVIGGEVSAVYLWIEDTPEGMWLGGVADAVWDFGSDAFRHRCGPEIGWGPIGLDVAYLGQARDEDYRPGISARGVFTLAIVSLYGGYGHVFVDGAGADFGEFGGLLKFPIPIAVDPPEPPMPLQGPGALQPLDPTAPSEGEPLRPVPAPPGSYAPVPKPPAEHDDQAEPYHAPSEPDEADQGRYATPPPPVPGQQPGPQGEVPPSLPEPSAPDSP